MRGIFYALSMMETVELNPYESPQHYNERPQRSWRPSSKGTKIFAAMLGLAGLGQLTHGGSSGELASLGGGLVLLIAAVGLWMVGNQPLFE
jgi:hypothetical protein